MSRIASKRHKVSLNSFHFTLCSGEKYGHFEDWGAWERGTKNNPHIDSAVILNRWHARNISTLIINYLNSQGNQDK